MTAIVASAKACTVNPLKLSPALGGALAFLGVERCLPLFHGTQGCTAFALVLDIVVTHAEARLLVWRPKTAETEAM